jgi:HlyD family secretion protein
LSRQRTIVLGLGAVAGAALLVLALRGPALLVETGTVASGPFSLTFQEEGKTRLKHRYLVSAPVAGTIRRIALEQGDAVKAGQVVAELEPQTSALLDPGNRARTQAEAASATSAVKAAQDRVAAARAMEQMARKDFDRQRALRQQGLVSQTQLEAAQMQADQSRANMQAALADQQVAEHKRDSVAALLALEGKRGGGETLALTAPLDGSVIHRYQESAVPVTASQPLLELGDPADIEIEVEALSTDAVKLKPGMRARVLRWGGERELAATVIRVEPGGYTKISALGVEEQRVKVILDLASPRAEWTTLGDGFRVEVEFVLWESPQTLQVPSSALFRSGDRWAVYLVDGGRARRAAVEIGARGGLATQVLSGLTAGQQVILHPDDKVADDVRVSPE